MPGSLAAEKAGSVANTHRLLQWHEKVVSGPGDSRSETGSLSSLPQAEAAPRRKHGSQGYMDRQARLDVRLDGSGEHRAACHISYSSVLRMGLISGRE